MTFLHKKLGLLNQLMSNPIMMRDCIPLGKLEAVIFHISHRARKQVCGIYFLISLFWGVLILSHAPLIQAEQTAEYRLKVAFLYNFAVYTEWPDPHNKVLNLCIHGEDPFGENLQHIRHKKVNEHELLIRHTENIEDLPSCQIIFITRSAVNNLSDIINLLNGKPILTIADTPGSSQQGVVLNMIVKEGRVIFEVNIASAKKNGLKLSSQLLRFAIEVYQ